MKALIRKYRVPLYMLGILALLYPSVIIASIVYDHVKTSPDAGQDAWRKTVLAPANTAFGKVVGSDQVDRSALVNVKIPTDHDFQNTGVITGTATVVATVAVTVTPLETPPPQLTNPTPTQGVDALKITGPLLSEVNPVNSVIAPQGPRQTELPWPSISAGAATVLDQDSGALLYTLNADAGRPMGGTAKIMTALVVRQYIEPTTVIPIKPEALVEGPSMDLRQGEKLQISDLLAGMLINNANDSASALADYTGSVVNPSQPDHILTFVSLMNAQALQLGLTHTHFVNPTGLDATDQYSSAHDLALLARAAMKYTFFSAAVSTHHSTVSSTLPDGNFVIHHLDSTNQFLETYPNADGIKNGLTGDAGKCLIASVSRDGHRVIVVILGAVNSNDDAALLFDYVFQQYNWAVK